MNRPDIPKKIKSNSYLSARNQEGYVYKPLSVLVMYEGPKHVLYVPYQGNLVPLKLYPFKTIVTYKNGRPTVYELKPLDDTEV